MTSPDFAPFPLIDWLSRRTRGQRRAAGTVLVAVLVVKFVIWLGIAQLDRWWYATVTEAPVWRVRVGSQVVLALVSGVVSAVFMAWALVRAARSEPIPGQVTFRPIAFVSGRLGPAKTWAAWGIPLYMALGIVAAATEKWHELVMFVRGGNLGVSAPEVGFDLGYHLFRLPLISTTLSWLSSLVFATLVGAWALLTLNGAIRLPIRGRQSAPQAIRLLSGLGAIWFVIAAGRYWFDLYPRLASIRSGRFTGAGYAEMHSAGLAYRPLAVLSVITAIVLVGVAQSHLRTRWVLTAAVVPILHGIAVIGLAAVLQRVVVAPTEAAREAPYVGHNLEATRTAYGISSVPRDELVVSGSTIAEPQTDRLPRFDRSSLPHAFQVLQGLTATKIQDVDLDRYEVDGVVRPVYVAARSSSLDELPERGWVHEHLVYTHGDGVVAALADETTESGGLRFDGVEHQLGQADDDLYFGEHLDGWYVFTGTQWNEMGGKDFTGTSGITVDSRWRQLIAAIGLGDMNVAFSSEFTADTQLLYRRSLAERVQAVAPFLRVDGDPYPVITSDGVVWMADAYVWSWTYPYAQTVDLRGIPGASSLHSITGANYVRHAAVVTLDARTGSLSLYRTDPDEPVSAAWDAALPGVFTPLSELPAELARHRRYPTDGFTVQTNVLGQYHVDTAAQLFSGSDAWLVSPDATRTTEDGAALPSQAVWMFSPLLDDDWSTVRPYSPGLIHNPASVRDELAAVAIGNQSTGELTVFDLGSTDATQLPSPRVAQSILASDPDISQLMTLLNANGSNVQFGPHTPLLTDQQLVWYRTLIVQSTAVVATPRLYSELEISHSGVTAVSSQPTPGE